ncbi:hypothetical protein BH20ACT24_BH20ACT24_19510 [soil metagenome]
MKTTTRSYVEPVGQRYRSQGRPGAGAGSSSATQEPEPLWDRGAELSHPKHARFGAPGRNRTSDTRFRNPLCTVARPAEATPCPERPGRPEHLVRGPVARGGRRGHAEPRHGQPRRRDAPHASACGAARRLGGPGAPVPPGWEGAAQGHPGERASVGPGGCSAASASGPPQTSRMRSGRPSAPGPAGGGSRIRSRSRPTSSSGSGALWTGPGVPADRVEEIVRWGAAHCPVSEAAGREVPVRLEINAR